ncbi:hypothetical protein SAMN05192533_101206 [Mesobacillus persicus]|uniref:Uncharacterized protein n=1 Tax=Mesobacillus persicus TaxID=930146 RepID=A0A1H7VZZ3_9BACI|nr:hypothetical protein [Mesobacillus persicus]SEM14790.1 hypothetical protein SAMN05192533_101206 [Mesobacillus persicus]
MILKSIDLSLMAEHLMIHKGVLARLESAFCSVHSNELKQIIYEQIVIMRNHVKVMLLLMDPNQNELVTVAALNELDPVSIKCQDQNAHPKEKNVAIELKNTAKTMANDNFNSALRMKAQNVRDIHINMALQQASLQRRYHHFLEQNMKEVSPESSIQEQVNTMNSIKNMFKTG